MAFAIPIARATNPMAISMTTTNNVKFIIVNFIQNEKNGAKLKNILETVSYFCADFLTQQIINFKAMKTDLSKILSISGLSGLYTYLSQVKSGAIVENLETKKRSCVAMNNKISSLEDISIYTEDGEVKLADVLLKMKEHLGDSPAPSPKSEADALKSLFAEVLPDYDRDRFYVSHMKKVVGWYNIIARYASFDFSKEGQEESSEETGDNAEEKQDGQDA